MLGGPAWPRGWGPSSPLASQSWKEAVPSCLVSSPPPQGKQLVRPGSGWYMPTGQAWQGLKPSAEKEPGEHWPGGQRSWLRLVGGAPRPWPCSQTSPVPGKRTGAPRRGRGGRTLQRGCLAPSRRATRGSGTVWPWLSLGSTPSSHAQFQADAALSICRAGPELRQDSLWGPPKHSWDKGGDHTF